MKPQDILKEKSSMWIFGYGSLVWKPDFAYKKSIIGHIRGYKRRFWHGDDFYRGDKEKVRFESMIFKREKYHHLLLVECFHLNTFCLCDVLMS